MSTIDASHSVPASVITWIERSFEPRARVASIVPMSRTATIQHSVDVVLADGAGRRLVLRRYPEARRLIEDPWYDPANEALALELLAGTAVPAPTLHAVDLSGEVPALLESWIPGATGWKPDLDRYLSCAAEALVSVHAVPPNTRLKTYAPYEHPRRLTAPAASTRPKLWERVASLLLESPRPAHRSTFIHRDYHPWNTLWDGQRITGIIDWLTAATGPAGIDLAHMRLNLAAHLGRGPADRFAAAYIAAGGDPSARHPYWDLLDATDLAPDMSDSNGSDVGDLARLEDFVETVLSEMVS
ncbi:MAG TPA: aminoglycoside phosphotransferase family protein [Candidatus Eisenbacteria bacterium]|nr:aminoglycoside phosphotransferase family protein [Candidatus Eisenbacteria bacterium]